MNVTSVSLAETMFERRMYYLRLSGSHHPTRSHGVKFSLHPLISGGACANVINDIRVLTGEKKLNDVINDIRIKKTN